MTPEKIAGQEFAHSFRGYDISDVRGFLARVAGEVRRVEETLERTRAELAEASAKPPPGIEDLTRDQLNQLLGEEAARVLRTADDAARDIRTRAEANVEKMLHEAQAEAKEIRAEAETIREEARAEADRRVSAADEIVATRLAEADSEALRRREAAIEEGRGMLAEAQAARERMLADLAGRRRDSRRELYQLRAGIEQLRESYDELRSMLDRSVTVVDTAVEDARRAAGYAAERFDRDDMTDDRAELGRELGLEKEPSLPRPGGGDSEVPTPVAEPTVGEGVEPATETDEVAGEGAIGESEGRAAPEAERTALQGAGAPAVEEAPPETEVEDTAATTPAESGTGDGTAAAGGPEVGEAGEAGLDEGTERVAETGASETRIDIGDSETDMIDVPAPTAGSESGEDGAQPEGIGSEGSMAGTATEDAANPDADGAADASDAAPGAETAPDSEADAPEETAGEPAAADTPEETAGEPADPGEPLLFDQDLEAEPPPDRERSRIIYRREPRPDSTLAGIVSAGTQGENSESPVLEELQAALDRAVARGEAPAEPEGGEPALDPALVAVESALSAVELDEVFGGPTNFTRDDSGPGPLGGPHAEIDELFARIREARETSVSKAREVLDRPSAPSVTAPAERVPAAEAAPVATTDRVEAAGVEALFRRQEQVASSVEKKISRLLKRGLADQLNEVLDAIRRSSESPHIDEVLPEGSIRTMAAGLRPLLIEAVLEGAGLFEGSEADLRSQTVEALDELVESVATDMDSSLRTRMEAFLAEPATAESGARGLYREWRRERLGPLARDIALAAYAVGVLDPVAPGSPVRWMLPEGGCVHPDCADNALATDVNLGSPFPSGHLRSPLAPGCRCLVVVSGI